MASRILIKNATIITMNEYEEVIDTGDLLIENDLIKSIGHHITDAQENDLLIKGDGRVVIPGLINLHNHAAMSLFRSYADDLPLKDWLEKKIFPAEAKLTGEDVYWGTSLALLEMLKGGTTTFVDMYYYMDEVARACLEGGIRAVLSHGIVGINSILASKTLQGAKDFVTNWGNEGNGRIKAIFGPHAPYTCPPDYFKQVLKETETFNNAFFHIHLAESGQEMKESLEKYNKTPVGLMEEIGLFERPVLAAHCVHVTDEDIDIMVKREVGISHNPGSNLKLGSGIAPLTKLLDKKTKVGLGTDGPASNNNLDMFEEIRLSSLLQKGYHEDPTLISANEALAMATRGGARALNTDNIGVLKEGAKADLAILNFKKPHLQPHANPVANIVYSASASDVETVIVDGKILVEKGNFLTLDEEKIYYEAAKSAKRLRQ